MPTMEDIIENYKKEKGNEMPQYVLDGREGFLFGADPELFVRNGEGEFISAEGLIPGTKEEPYKVEGGAIQVDGMAAEFNIDPAATFKDFNRNIERVMKQLQEMLPAGCTLDSTSAVRFKPEIFDASPDKAKMLGCSPDFNAWTGEINPPPKDPDDPYFRCLGGHLHVGWTEGADMSDQQHIMNGRDLVKQFDWFLGGWSTKMDSDPTRRNLYGRAGACRFKDYGVEYRVLSSFWVTSRDRRLSVWNRMQQAIGAMSKSFYPEAISSSYSDQLVAGINSCSLPADLTRTFKYPLVSADAMYARV